MRSKTAHRSPAPTSRSETVPPGLRGLGSGLKKARHRTGLTLQELAARAGCSVSMLSKIENDKVLPSLTTLHNIVAVLNFNIGYLFDGGHQEDLPVLKEGSRPVIM